jgi:hypothetical protein
VLLRAVEQDVVMMAQALRVVLLGFALAGAACEGTGVASFEPAPQTPGAPGAPPTLTTAPPMLTTAPPTPPPPPTAISVGDAALAADRIGVVACDAYVAAINACVVPRLPPQARDEILAPMKQLRFAWKQRAGVATAAQKTALAAECAAKLAGEASALEAAGCRP